MTSPLALSPQASIAVESFGAEQQPLVRIENALPDVALVRTIAQRHSYKPIGPFYPGIRAAVSEAIAMPLVAPVAQLLQKTFALDAPPAYFECYLSIVTSAPGELTPIQRLPHFDGIEPDRLAVLLYLSDDADGGTAFYRQRSTGFESVDASRFETYRARLDEDVAQHGLPESGYISATSPLFERTHRVGAKAGRMIIYRGNVLHCSVHADDFVPSADPKQGRLSLNLFLKENSRM